MEQTQIIYQMDPCVLADVSANPSREGREKCFRDILNYESQHPTPKILAALVEAFREI